MRLILIRHAQTPSNVLGLLDTAEPGPALTGLGLEQSGALVDSLKIHSIDALFASTLLRTQLTAEPLSRARGLGVQVQPGFREIEAGTLELRRDREAVRQYLETVYSWGMGGLGVAMPGGTDGHTFFGRFDRDVEAVVATGADTAAVVSHGAAIRVWVSSRARNISPSFGAENPLDNTGIVVLDGDPLEGWELKSWEGSPVGGRLLADGESEDPTGESLEEAINSAPDLPQE